MSKIKIIFWGILLIALYIVFGAIFNGEHVKTIIFTLSSIFIVSVYFSIKYKLKNLLDCIVVIIPIVLLFLVSGILLNDFSRILAYILFIPVSNILAYWYARSRNKFIILISFVFFYMVGVCFFGNIFSFISNREAKKNILFPNITLLNSKKQKVNLSKNKIIILDFWSTSCGICFEKFPDLEKTFKKYKKNKNVEIYAVNFPLKRDSFNETIKILDNIGYDFPKLYSESAKEIEDSLHFNTFPHLIIIKNAKIRFDGMFLTKSDTFIYNVENEIDALLKE